MRTFLILAFLFFVGSCSGWVIELLFRRFFTAKKWINPGFLTGPYLPIYGFGLVVLYVLSNVNLGPIQNFPYPWNALCRILIITIAVTLVEYIGGLIFIKGMNIKLWDYSNRWGNIQGIICPLFTLFWFAGTAIYYFFINPYIENIVCWFVDNITFSFFVGMFFGFMLVDLSFAINLSVKIRKIARENKLVVQYEKLKEAIAYHTNELKQKAKFIMPFKSSFSLKEAIVSHLPKLETYRQNSYKEKLRLRKERHDKKKEKENNINSAQ